MRNKHNAVQERQCALHVDGGVAHLRERRAAVLTTAHHSRQYGTGVGRLSAHCATGGSTALPGFRDSRECGVGGMLGPAASAARGSLVSKSLLTTPWLSRSAIAQFGSHLLATQTCTIWLGAVGSDGYGRFSVRSGSIERIVSPHLVAATLKFGPVPVGLTLMHDCEVRIRVATRPRSCPGGDPWGEHAAGRAAGESSGARPGLVDVRGNVNASRAIQEALHAQGATGSSPAQLACRCASESPGRRRPSAREGRPVRSAAAERAGLADPVAGRPR